MLYTVVISHHQSTYINSFGRLFGDRNVVFVFDALTDDDISVIGSYPSFHAVSVIGSGNRSRNRNAGLSYIENNFRPSDDDIIEFFDGDRVPVKYAGPCMSNADVLLYTCENDKRLMKLVPGPVLTNTLCNPFYSCGFAIKYSAIKKIKTINNENLFNEEFLGWGCEDQYLGLQCAKLDFRILLTDMTVLAGSVGGDELSHDNYGDTLQQYIDITLKNGLFPKM